MRHAARISGPPLRWIAPSTPPPPQQRGVRGVDDRVGVHVGDTALDQGDAWCGHELSLWRGNAVPPAISATPRRRDGSAGFVERNQDGASGPFLEVARRAVSDVGVPTCLVEGLGSAGATAVARAVAGLAVHADSPVVGRHCPGLSWALSLTDEARVVPVPVPVRQGQGDIHVRWEWGWWHPVEVDLELPGDSGWMFDLVSRHPHRRDAAMARHAQSTADLDHALRAVNALWWKAGKTPSPTDPGLAAAMTQARAACAVAVSNTVHGVVGEFHAVRWAGDLEDYRRLSPYAVLFLQWEADFPEQWRAAGPWSAWGVKKRVLRQFADMGVPDQEIGAVTRLVVRTIDRDQRCEDLGYVLVAGSLDGPVLRAGIDAALHSPTPSVRLRAGYVRWAVDNAQAPVTLASWRAWRAADAAIYRF